jgi:hypothetical protein
MGEGTLMLTTDVPVDFASETAEEGVEAQSPSSQWAETALTVLFTATAVLFVSFIAAVTGLI